MNISNDINLFRQQKVETVVNKLPGRLSYTQVYKVEKERIKSSHEYIKRSWRWYDQLHTEWGAIC